ncbi:carotenoid oxygenase family protein [Halorarius halobius]|uniref:carotenoid oxygenase family protein n=1 Tax=Halorarius halobius TaxID=2962671 RepID=UPI0020CC79D0|nr:carotenoid oxygenase family protein [Halorarius halobius]
MSSDDATLGFRSQTAEFVDEPLPVEGEIPSWLDGRLVRNGPGRFEAGGERFTHWFDGLAMLRAFDFADGRVRLTTAFPRTEAYRDALDGDASGQFATDETGLSKTLGWLRRLGPPEPTDNANVHVARIDGTLTALTEVPRWVTLDDDLTATGELAFEDDLDTTTAHLTRDDHRDELVGFGTSFGRTHSYELFRIPDGQHRREPIASVAVDTPRYVHDCVTTREHVVVVAPPLEIDLLRALSPFTEGFFEMLSWNPDAGTRLFVVDRDSGALIASPTVDPFFTFHSVNAHLDGRAVVLDLVAFEDAAIVADLSLDALERGGYDDAPQGRLVRLRVPLDGGDVTRSRRYDGGLELPTVPRPVRGRPYRYAYAQATDRTGANGLVKVDVRRGRAREWWERGLYVEEPRMVQRPGATREDDGVVLAPALDTTQSRTVLLVLDARTLEELARAPLPHHLPFGFHGRFFDRS